MRKLTPEQEATLKSANEILKERGLLNPSIDATLAAEKATQAIEVRDSVGNIASNIIEPPLETPADSIMDEFFNVDEFYVDDHPDFNTINYDIFNKIYEKYVAEAGGLASKCSCRKERHRRRS